MALTFDTHSTSLIHLDEFFNQLETLDSKKKLMIFTFSYTKAYVTKFDLGVKWVKVNPGS